MEPASTEASSTVVPTSACSAAALPTTTTTAANHNLGTGIMAMLELMMIL